jgi:hypothetical protein
VNRLLNLKKSSEVKAVSAIQERVKPNSSTISYWCTFGHKEINSVLRTGEVATKRNEGEEEWLLEEAAHLIDLASRPLHSSATLFRGISLVSAPKVGEILTDKGLQAFTRKLDYAIVCANRNGELPTVLKVKAKFGFDIDSYTSEMGFSDGSESAQAEVLKAPSRFRVVAMENFADYTLIEVEECAN